MSRTDKPVHEHLAFDGVRRLEVPEADAQDGTGAANDLYRATDKVIAQLRLSDTGSS